MKDAILDLHSKTQKLSFTQLKAYIENLTSIFEEGQFERPTIVISSLNIGDVQVLLKLTHSLDNLEFCNRTPVELSPVCGTYPLRNVQVNVTHN